MPAIESKNVATRWITRLVSILLAVAVGYATYVIPAHLAVDLYLHEKHDSRIAVPILVLYFILLFLMVTTYARTLYTAYFDPGVVPLGPRAIARLEKESQQRQKTQVSGDIESRAYDAGPDIDPDSPGIENFYTRDVFICEPDGRPRWCSECCNWKQDRVHHSSEIGRCVYRMDHYCPWVGGMIGENSFKFFVQFVIYAALYCGLILGVAGYTVHRTITEHKVSVITRDISILISVTGIAGFFGLFSFAMAVTSMNYVLQNLTNVESLANQHKSYKLAVRIARDTRPEKFGVIVYPLPKPDRRTNKSETTSVGPYENSPATENNDGAAIIQNRDDLATRIFGILVMEKGENPWDLGFWNNWKSVMGTTPLDWLLPIRKSPCANHESQEAFYPMGHALENLRARYGVPAGPPSDESTVIEMRRLRDQQS
ncbi:palmitoyltransferase PFA5 [Xylariaceae sp. FL0255]|nr:palmitoyltransferase PFA5 [Xylariaceae sp. FL0255]